MKNVVLPCLYGLDTLMWLLPHPDSGAHYECGHALHGCAHVHVHEQVLYGCVRDSYCHCGCGHDLKTNEM